MDVKLLNKLATEDMLWAISRHSATNHYYDTYLPYEFHLRMVNKVCDDFIYLIDQADWIIVKAACWCHDLIEDTRTSYNEVSDKYGKRVADIVFAVTNEKGRTRAERANETYYVGIKADDLAVFVKLCDRIANVQYSKMTGSRMFEKYKGENNHFLESIAPKAEFQPMVDYLLNLFE